MNFLSKEKMEFVDKKIRGQADAPLSASGALAALLVVEGVLSLEDAANAVRVSEQDLIKEAQAWALGAIIESND